MVAPELLVAPAMLPVIVPGVHIKVLGTLAVNEILGSVPLQILAIALVVIAGAGFTVRVIVKATPEHEPVVEVGVIIYCTVPATELLEMINVWLMLVPEPMLVPITAPVIVPIVHAKALVVVAVNEILGLMPLQIAAVAALLIAGVGFTVTVIATAVLPIHEPVVEVGVTIYSTMPARLLLGLVSV